MDVIVSLAPVVIGSLVALLALSNSLRERARVRKLIEGLHVDDDVEVVHGERGATEVNTRRPHRMAKLTSNGSSWDGTADAPFAGAVTWLYMTTWRHQNSFRMETPSLRSLSISAALPDVARAVLLEPRVNASVSRIFGACRANALHLNADGRLLVRLPVTANPDAKTQVLALAELAEALEQTPAARALPRPRVDELEALGGASGAPVGVPGRR